MNFDLTPEQQADVEKRVAAFKEEYKVLSEKYEVDFGGYPEFQSAPGGIYSIAVRMVAFDKKYLPVSSPIQDVIKE